MRKILSIALIILLFFTSAIHAATYYVATTGNNGDPGTEAQPWLTLTYAESQLSNADTVIVRGGTYNENFTINVVNVTFQNYPSESPIIDGDWALPGGTWGVLVNIEGNGVTLDGFEVQKSTGMVIEVQGADNVTIKNCDIHKAFRCCIRAEYSDNLLVEDSEIYDGVWRRWCYENPGQVGVHPACPVGLSYSTPWPANVAISKSSDYATFRRCKVYDSHWEGLTAFDDVIGTTVEYCEIYGNERMQLYFNCSKDCLARYNLIYGTTDGIGYGIWLNSEAYCYDSGYEGNHEIYGNLVANTERNFFVAGSGARPVKNVKAYNNTFIEATIYNASIASGGSGHIFKNNIIWQTGATISDIASGITTVDYNLWSREPDVDARGANDPSYAAPLLTKTSGWQAGAGLTGSDFTLQDSSPAINVGTDLGASYDDGLNPSSVWTDSVSTLDQDDYGLWEIGGVVYTGTILPVVTTQAVTDITTTTAIGHGTITDVGGESNCTKRGICWNTTGSPTVADDNVMEVGSFPAGAFSGNMTGLTPDQAYFARACAYNTDGYGYGSTEGFNADADASGTYIIDDGDAETSSTGTWSASGGANPYGSGSLYCHAVNSTYTYEKTLDGNYTVSLWWTEYASRSSSVTVKIYDSGDNLLDTKSVNQTTLGGQWNEQDTYDFNATAKVVILSTGGAGPVSTCADAVKFDYVEGSGGEDVNNPSCLRGIHLHGCVLN